MIEVIIRRVPAKDSTDTPLAAFNLGEPGEVVSEAPLWRVRLSDSAEAAKTRDATGAASHEEASTYLLRLVHRIIGQALKQRPAKRRPPEPKSPKGRKLSGLKKRGR